MNERWEKLSYLCIVPKYSIINLHIILAWYKTIDKEAIYDPILIGTFSYADHLC